MSDTDAPRSTPAPGHPDLSPEQQALQDAVAGLLATLAKLAVARGLPYAALDEMLKRAFVQAADAAHPGLLPHRKVSRISTATGINRREVTRLVQAQDRPGSRTRSLASEVFAHWRTQRPYRTRDGEPLALPRQGPEPSFETLSQAVTRDVHPRSLLDELCRLGLANWDEASDRVTLAREAFVPRGDRVRMLGFLGDNVGDHLRAAVDNVLRDDRMHFEQAIFAGGLSAESIEAMRPAIRTQWQALLAALVPALESFVETDGQRQPAPGARLRVGLYTYTEGEPGSGAEPPTAGKPAPTSAKPTARARRGRKESST